MIERRDLALGLPGNATQQIITIFDDLVELAKDPSAVNFAFFCTVISVLITLFNIFQHVRNYTHPVVQKQVIRILCTIPVYSIFSYWMLIDFKNNEYYLALRDVWEAIIVYSFLILILQYGGGEANCIAVIMNHPGVIDHPPPFGYCFPKIRLDAHFMRICKRSALQFVVVMPTLAAFNVIMLSSHAHESAGLAILESIIFNVSYSVALYALVLFYFATHEHPGISSKRPLAKFLSIKSLVFLTYYQGLILPAQFNALLICWEMLVFTILLNCMAFSWTEFDMSKDPTRSAEVGIGDDADGSSTVPAAPPQRMQQSRRMIRNTLDVVSFRDIQQDTLHNFSKKYQSHVQVEGEISDMASIEDHTTSSDEEKNGIQDPKKFGNDVVVDITDILPSNEKSKPRSALNNTHRLLSNTIPTTTSMQEITAEPFQPFGNTEPVLNPKENATDLYNPFTDNAEKATLPQPLSSPNHVEASPDVSKKLAESPPPSPPPRRLNL